MPLDILHDTICSREISILRKDIDFERGIETVASTDKPVLVIDWERFEFIREVLPPKYFQPIAGDKVPLLDSHSRFSVNNIVGSAREFRVNGNELLAKTFVSDSEPKVRQKIQEGHIDSVSIGYRVYKEFSMDVPKGKDVTVDGQTYRNDFEDNIPFVVRTKYEVKELSLVAIGANDAAKFRSIMAFDPKSVFERFETHERLIRELTEKITQLEGNRTTVNKSTLQRKLKLMEYQLKNYVGN